MNPAWLMPLCSIAMLASLAHAAGIDRVRSSDIVDAVERYQVWDALSNQVPRVSGLARGLLGYSDRRGRRVVRDPAAEWHAGDGVLG